MGQRLTQPELEERIGQLELEVERLRRTEAALRGSEEKYRLLVDNAEFAVIVTSLASGKILFLNERATLLFEASAAEMAGLQARDFWVHPEDRDRFLADLSSQGRLTGYECQLKSRGGSVRWVHISANRIDYAGEQAAFIVYNDITERKRAEQELRKHHEELNAAYQQLVAYDREVRQNYQELAASQQALRQSEEKYRVLTENASDIIWSVDMDWNFTYVSPSGERLLGWTMEEWKSIRPEDILTPASLDQARKALEEELSLEGSPGIDPSRTRTFESEQFRKDGSILWVEVTAGFLRDPEGRPNGIMGVSRDITARRRAGEDRNRLEERLRQAQKMEAIGTLAGGIAHDFNNVLMAMIGYTELARREPSGEGREELLNQVLLSCDRAKNLINQILTFSRMRELEKQPVQINPIIKEGLKLLRASIPSTVEIRQRIERKPAIVIADPTQIHQILLNLCTNSAQAMREKGGVLEVVLSLEKIEAAQKSQAHGLDASRYAKLTVSDTGHGIEPAILARVFDPFFTTKRQGEGTGLGLSVVYGIVKSCGGAIDISSERGRGTTVTVYLPLIEAYGAAHQAAKAEIRGGRERILFVDDEPLLIELGTRILHSLGYEVTARTSSIEALELFRVRHRDFDLVLTDMTMPNMTGADLAREIMAIRPDTPVILCTGYSEIMTEQKAREMGIRSFIMKPVNRSDLGTVIRDVLDAQKK